MPQIIPIKDLRNTTEISRKCHETNEPIFVTKNGYGDMVLMSIATYERDIARTELLNKIAVGEEDLRSGNVIEAESAFKDLRNEFFD
ncbi:type II toxin-antitoxin system Phd/YefM family antitoxin [Thiospirochaeta perfilievii]|uniref:Antitoxin n=1 Tax=Thiospirochaeta perfilievii TaxID=252967 RepID=A0A5C1Q8N7_9SPIO|nr:type II toxin-antitoxin system Phd/YefM family antitoxin [Thiospirochaeta perfilievii]QEN03410.1 type II toxin-antitoxin system Phd/YefM family antitoxin [Thiospirochaeta perfilievii]